MNGQTITISRKLRAEDLLSELEAVEKALAALKKKITTAVAVKRLKYGSDAWWENSDRKALKELKAGKGKKFNSYEEAMHYLNS